MPDPLWPRVVVRIDGHSAILLSEVSSGLRLVEDRGAFAMDFEVQTDLDGPCVRVEVLMEELWAAFLEAADVGLPMTVKGFKVHTVVAEVAVGLLLDEKGLSAFTQSPVTVECGSSTLNALKVRTPANDAAISEYLA